MRSAWAFILSLVVAGSVRAADPPAPSGDHPQVRAGNAQCVAWYAVPGVSPMETGGYVGGGCLFRRGPRGPEDGTWGWDYVGKGNHPGRIFLGWCGCGREKPGGTYKTDGPPVPDVFSVKPIKRALS